MSQWGKQSANHTMKISLEERSTSRQVGKMPTSGWARKAGSRIWGWVQEAGRRWVRGTWEGQDPCPHPRTTAACPSSLSGFIHTPSVHLTNTGRGPIQARPGESTPPRERTVGVRYSLQLHNGSYAWSRTPGLGRVCDANQPIQGLPETYRLKTGKEQPLTGG